MPVYILILTAMWLIFQIAINSIQRQHEAEADVYGVRLAVARGVPLEKAKLTLIMLSEKSRHDPEPFWLFKYLFYDHPPLGERLSNIAKVETRSPEGVRRQ